MSTSLMIAMGVFVGMVLGYALAIAADKDREKHYAKRDKDTISLGVLYIYEGQSKNRYAFAFDCPLDHVGQFKYVTFKVCKKHERTIDEIEESYFAGNSEYNME